MDSCATSADGRDTVLLLALHEEEYVHGLNALLYELIDTCATRRLVESAGAFRRLIKLTPKPLAVLVLDPAITEPENKVVLQDLVKYVVEEGGIVVCACNFSSGFAFDRVRPFFDTWGVSWDTGSYHRTTVHLNKSSLLFVSSTDSAENSDAIDGVVTPTAKLGLHVSYSVKYLLLTNVDFKCAIYYPNEGSRVQSHVFPPNAWKIKTDETPCAYTPLGKGFFGYVGDVNYGEVTSMVIIAMLGLSAPVVRVKADRVKDKGNTFFRIQRWSEAAEAYKEAIYLGSELVPLVKIAVYRTNLAAAYLKLKKFADAAQSCDEALRDDPDNIKAHYRLGLAKRELQQYQKAIEEFSACQRLDPNDLQFAKEIEDTEKLFTG